MYLNSLHFLSSRAHQLFQGASVDPRRHFSKTNINPYLLIIRVLIISASFAGTEVKFTGIMFIVNVIYHHTWSVLLFKFKLYLLETVHISADNQTDTGVS